MTSQNAYQIIIKGCYRPPARLVLRATEQLIGALKMRTTKTLLLASIALGAICTSEAANAQTIILGGGATFPSVAYRNLFDCATHQATGTTGAGALHVTTPLTASCTAPPHVPFLFLYAPVGSGAGKAGFTAHSDINTNPPGNSNAWNLKKSGNIPITDDTFEPNFPYPDPTGIQFAGSDDLLLPSDVATYNTNNGPANWGNILFMPAVIGPVAISINPTKDGAGAAWLIAPNTIKLSRKSVCGIFTGHITHWDATSITADNGGTVGTGLITVVHRADGSGTNFLLTNALTYQCQSAFGANKDDGPAPSDPTLVLYEFAWTNNGTPVAQCPALPFVGANLNNWPDLVNDQCGHAIPNPGGGTFTSATGNQGVANAVVATNGALGYNTADQVQPIVPTGPATANLQSQYDIDNVTGLYHLPTAAGAQAAMAAVTPVFNTTADRANPLNWASQGTVPNPAQPGSYPIAGFSWFLFYQCYASANVASALQAYIQWHYSNVQAAGILGDNGMAVPPASWVSQIQQLLTTTSPIGHTGDGGVCTAKTGA
jgi:ABC-type phosphate transport system substrate-binding protein